MLSLLFSLLATPAMSRTVLDLDTQQQPVALKDWGDYWLDSSGALTALQVSQAAGNNWQPTQEQLIYPLKARQALWVRFTVQIGRAHV